SLYCAVQLRRYAAGYVGAPSAHPHVSLWRHVRSALAPIAGLAVIAVLQNIDIIAAKHRFSTHTATSYAAVAVAAKVMILLAIGAVAVAEPVLLLQASRQPAGFAAVVLAIQAVGAFVAFALALRRENAPPQAEVSPEPA